MEEGDPSGRGMAGTQGAAVGAAWGLGTARKASRSAEETEKSPAERREGVLEVGRSPGRGEAGRRQKTDGWQVEVLRRRGAAGLARRTAVAGTPGEQERGPASTQDPSRRREERLAGRKGVAPRERKTAVGR